MTQLSFSISLLLYYFIFRNTAIDTCTHSEIPKKAFVPTSGWKDIVQSSITRYDFRWINPRYVGYNPKFPKSIDKRRGSAGENATTTNEDASSDSTDSPRKHKRVAFINYTCGVPRNLQKASKKAGCKARVKMICYKENPDMVEVLHIGNHNHEVGGADRLKHLPSCLARPSIVQPQSQSVETNASSSRSRVLNIISNIEAVYNTFKNSSRELTNEQIDNVSEIANNLFTVLQESNDLASNSNFSTQRR
ncbi:hypothetical protein BY458DRAFT_552834 [Sporodiniella umbellata]|nr:hypothetical protein BY458DRAFT_552834 [Sporodiniella umbellata]